MFSLGHLAKFPQLIRFKVCFEWRAHSHAFSTVCHHVLRGSFWVYFDVSSTPLPPYLSQWFFQSARQESQTCRCRAFAQIIQREPPQVGYVDSDWFIPEGICIFIQGLLILFNSASHCIPRIGTNMDDEVSDFISSKWKRSFRTKNLTGILRISPT